MLRTTRGEISLDEVSFLLQMMTKVLLVSFCSPLLTLASPDVRHSIDPQRPNRHLQHCASRRQRWSPHLTIALSSLLTLALLPVAILGPASKR